MHSTLALHHPPSMGKPQNRKSSSKTRKSSFPKKVSRYQIQHAKSLARSKLWILSLQRRSRTHRDPELPSKHLKILFTKSTYKIPRSSGVRTKEMCLKTKLTLIRTHRKGVKVRGGGKTLAKALGGSKTLKGGKVHPMGAEARIRMTAPRKVRSP